MKIQLKSIKTRLMIWFLIVALLPLMIVCTVIYLQRVDAIKTEAFNKLKVIRDLKVHEINYWIDERAGDVQAFSAIVESKDMDDILTGNTEITSESKTLQNLSSQLKRIRNSYADYAEIFVVSAQSGVIKVSTDPSQEGENISGNKYFTEPLRTEKAYISSIYNSRSLNRYTMEFSFPIHMVRNQNHSPCGVLVARIDLEKSVYPLLFDRTGLGKTGETLIVNEDVLALNELRWHSGAPLKLEIKAEPAVLASQGKNGIVETLDYRGEMVLAAYTHIPKTGWGFVAKVDLAEIYAPIQKLFTNIMILFSVVVLAVCLVALFIARRTTQPILDIAGVAKRIREGDLSARNRISSQDEIGYLAESFNQTAEAVMLQIDMEKKNTDLTETLILQKELKKFGETVLEKFMEVTESQLGTFYLRRTGENSFAPLAAIGVNHELLEPFDASIFEGEFGTALSTGKMSHIRNIPEDTPFTFKTFAGTAIPREIITLPVVVDKEVRAMICLASLGEYNQAALMILNQSAIIALNTAFANLLANDETRRLSEELREINQELQAQQEELETQAEELQKQSEELQVQNVELEQQRIAVEDTSRMKSQFLSNMSHELRTPLNSVMALSRVLMMQATEKLSTEEVNYLEIIERNGKNLLLLINDILDLSKIEAGRMDINPKPFSLGTTLENIVESITPIAKEKKIEINQDIPGSLPPLESDEIRVSQIMQNIIGNAVKFTSTGSVTVSVQKEKEKFVIQVADTGIGIAKKDLPHIFDEFRQVDGSSSRRHEGTGLGLAIARKATRMLGGDISVTSALETGSTFTLSLPITWQGVELPNESFVSKELSGVKPERKTILVVDDEPEIAEMISNCLRQDGYNTLTATSGSEALKLAASERPFAITLDVIMPDMDGWEVLQGLKKNPETKDIPVIIASISEERETGIALGAAGFISKPVSNNQLMSEIHKIGRPKNRSIMIVDDNEAVIIQIKAVLESAGYQVYVARGGQEAFDYVSHTIPDGIILDLMMPEIDGFAVLEKVRGTKATGKIPVLILTAKDLTPEDFKKLSANNVQQLVQKGDIDLDSLLFKVKSMVDVKAQLKVKADNLSPGIQDLKPALLQVEQVKTRKSPSKIPKLEGDPSIILVIEDNPDNMITFKAVLQNRYQILEATNGEEGLRVAEEARPDIILLDMALPKMDGFTVVRNLKEHTNLSNIPVIAITAQVMKGDREKILEAGCDDYIAKPINTESLLKKIVEWLKG